jgi:hypothetical protein
MYFFITDRQACGWGPPTVYNTLGLTDPKKDYYGPNAELLYG